jgi:histidinol phosphatase-like enzyme (inositol monophosphatase family)
MNVQDRRTRRLAPADPLTLKAKQPQPSTPVPNSDNLDSQALLDLAHSLADKAGAVILPHFRTQCAVDHKGGDLLDPVTAADRAAEIAIRDGIVAAYPEHGILGEEFGVLRDGAEYRWVIDPIDGTRAFILGQPLWGTLIGLTRRGAPLLGMMDQPFTKERFWADDREAFYRYEGRTMTMRTRPCPALAEAFLAASSPDLFTEEKERERFAALSRAVRIRRFGGDCYNYCLLALGHLDLVAEAGLQPFDIVPLIPIIERAGGVVSTWGGGDACGGGRILAAGDPRLHEAAVEMLSG